MVKKQRTPTISKETLALFSLICGIVGFLIPAGGLAAIILGIIALRGGSMKKEKRIMAWIGIALGCVKILMLLFFIGIMVLAGLGAY
jgi:hypothetical protein